MKRIKMLLLVPLLIGCINAGCNADPYTVSVKAGSDIAIAVSAGMKAVDQTRQNGLMNPQEETKVLGYLKFVNDADGAFLNCAAAAHSAGSKLGSFTACATQFNQTLNNPTELALIQVSNSQAQADINAIVAGLVTGVNALITGLGGK